VGSSADLEVPSLHALRVALPGLWADPPALPVLAAANVAWPAAAAATGGAAHVPAVARAQGVEVDADVSPRAPSSRGGWRGSCDAGLEAAADGGRFPAAQDELLEESKGRREVEVAAGR
jgi:hypothetical protein